MDILRRQRATQRASCFFGEHFPRSEVRSGGHSQKTARYSKCVLFLLRTFSNIWGALRWESRALSSALFFDLRLLNVLCKRSVELLLLRMFRKCLEVRLGEGFQKSVRTECTVWKDYRADSRMEMYMFMNMFLHQHMFRYAHIHTECTVWTNYRACLRMYMYIFINVFLHKHMYRYVHINTECTVWKNYRACLRMYTYMSVNMFLYEHIF